MIDLSGHRVLVAVSIVAVALAVGSAAAFGIASMVGSSTDSSPLVSESLPIGDRPVVTPTAEERKLAELVGISGAALMSPRELFESPEAGRMLFFPRLHGGCLVMSEGTSCGDPNDQTLPVLSLMTSIDSTPYLIGGGIARTDVVAVVYKDSTGREIRFPTARGIFKVETSDRLTRDAQYFGTEMRTRTG